MLWESGARPLVVVNKCDLVANSSEYCDAAESVAPGVPIHAASAATGDGIEALVSSLRARKTVALVGSSGVGKSSLVNCFAGNNLLAVGEVQNLGLQGPPHDERAASRKARNGPDSHRHAWLARSGSLVG